MGALRAMISLVAICGPLLVGCGSDICEEPREAFCQKACDCDDGTCLVRLGGASLQYYDSVEECIDLAGPQICNSDSTEQAADACLQAIESMEACGDEVAPTECIVSASSEPGG
jgi:hypothetical protein